MKKWALIGIGIAIGLWVAEYPLRRSSTKEPIRLGLLHSQTGVMAISEAPLIDAELMATDEINAAGGIQGRKIEPVIADGKSDPSTFGSEAERLIRDEKVVTLVGCWTSASRKMVKPVVERYNHLLIYPMAYEGLEQSPNIIYTGAAPNQQIAPAVQWSIDHLGKRFFLIGSDYVWPHSINEIVSDQLKATGATKVGEAYVTYGSDNVSDAVGKIRAAKPDVVLSSIVGTSNIAFYKALWDAGIRPDKTAVISVSIGEGELQQLPTEQLTGHYAAWGYFQSNPRSENRDFVARFRKRYGADRVTDDVIETAYFSIILWAHAAQESERIQPMDVRNAMLKQSIDAPEGLLSVDPETQHVWRYFSIGKIRADRQFDLVWDSQKAIRPVPYPSSRTHAEWDEFLQNLYDGWKGNWANPGAPTALKTIAGGGR